MQMQFHSSGYLEETADVGCTVLWCPYSVLHYCTVALYTHGCIWLYFMISAQHSKHSYRSTAQVTLGKGQVSCSVGVFLQLPGQRCEDAVFAFSTNAEQGGKAMHSAVGSHHVPSPIPVAISPQRPHLWPHLWPRGFLSTAFTFLSQSCLAVDFPVKLKVQSSPLLKSQRDGAEQQE